MILKLLYIIYSKSAQITLSVCVAVGKFVCDVNGGKPVRSFFVYVKTKPSYYFGSKLTKYETTRCPERSVGKRSHLKDVYLC